MSHILYVVHGTVYHAHMQTCLYVLFYKYMQKKEDDDDPHDDNNDGGCGGVDDKPRAFSGLDDLLYLLSYRCPQFFLKLH